MMATFYLFHLIELDIKAAALAEASPSLAASLADLKHLDLHFLFTPDTAYQVARDLGSAGRSLYLSQFSPVDAVFPLIYGMFMSSALSILYETRFGTWVRFVPLVTIFADYIENTCIATVLAAYPNRKDVAGLVGGLANAVKHTSFSTISLVILLGAASVGLARLFGKGKGPASKKTK
ncbi:hypothetical protein HK102_003700 [Quaeritorhiza haematococci]|nr:hypothetical protein HK102_003700 [Quaeritorhiza haematococci]